MGSVVINWGLLVFKDILLVTGICLPCTFIHSTKSKRKAALGRSLLAENSFLEVNFDYAGDITCSCCEKPIVNWCYKIILQKCRICRRYDYLERCWTVCAFLRNNMELVCHCLLECIFGSSIYHTILGFTSGLPSKF